MLDTHPHSFIPSFIHSIIHSFIHTRIAGHTYSTGESLAWINGGGLAVAFENTFSPGFPRMEPLWPMWHNNTHTHSLTQQRLPGR